MQLLRRRFAKCRAAHLAVAGAASQVLDYEPRPRDEQRKRQADSGPSDCYPDLSGCNPDVSGCVPDIPFDACDAAGALDGLGGCDGIACCDLSF